MKTLGRSAIFPMIILASVFQISTAKALVCEVALNDINQKLVPQVLVGKGDREFGGNGPDIWSNVKIKVSKSGSQLLADVYFRARETKSDWSETKQNFTDIPVWRAPHGQKINRIVSDDYSETKFRSKKAGFQIFGPTKDWVKVIDTVTKLSRVMSGDLMDNPEDLCKKLGENSVVKCKSQFENFLMVLNHDNFVHVVPPKKGKLVSSFFIVGDTGGDDISNDANPKDDTRIEKIAFNKVRVDLRGAKSCPKLPNDRVVYQGGKGTVVVHQGNQSSTHVSPSGKGKNGGKMSTGTVYIPPVILNPQTSSSSMSCAASVQDKIAWDYKGNKRWGKKNIDRLCKGAEKSSHPARCFNAVMHKGYKWDAGTRWHWANAIDLCEGTRNSNAILGCYQWQVSQGQSSKDAVSICANKN